MPFCTNCGKKISDGTKYCYNCGVEVLNDNFHNFTTREAIYEGSIHKCPHCGEVLNSFCSNCPSCGYEIRNAHNSDAIRAFASELSNTTTNQKKATIIRSFPIPNTKEDILEFMILASTNIDDNLDNDISSAWISKAIPHKDCGRIAPSDFSSDCIKAPQEYWRISR